MSGVNLTRPLESTPFSEEVSRPPKRPRVDLPDNPGPASIDFLKAQIEQLKQTNSTLTDRITVLTDKVALKDQIIESQNARITAQEALQRLSAPPINPNSAQVSTTSRSSTHQPAAAQPRPQSSDHADLSYKAYNRATSLRSEGKLDDALKAIEESFMLRRSCHTLQFKTEILRQQGKFDEALKAIEGSSKHWPNSATFPQIKVEILYNKAKAHFQLNELDQAESCCKQIVAIRPHDVYGLQVLKEIADKRAAANRIQAILN